MDVLIKDVRKNVLGSMMYAYMILSSVKMTRDMTEYSETWRKALENRGMRISRPTIQTIDFKFGQDNGKGREPVKILWDELHRVHHFKYIGTSAEETGVMAT